MCTNKYPNPPHKHAELIKAWADGAEIQYYFHGEFQREWRDCGREPSWGKYQEYRIKPITKKYRVVLHVDGPHVARNDVQGDNLEKSKHFIRWLTDWVEYEV